MGWIYYRKKIKPHTFFELCFKVVVCPGLTIMDFVGEGCKKIFNVER